MLAGNCLGAAMKVDYANLVEPKSYIFNFPWPSGQSCESLINDLALLEKNWDGHQGEAISETVITNAKQLMENLKSVPLPDIVPSPDGTLSFSWESEDGWAQIDIGNDSFAIYVERNDTVLLKEGGCRYTDLPQIEAFAAYIAQTSTQD